MTAYTALFYWLFPIIAIVYVVGYSALFAPLREWGKLPGIVRVLLDCPMCIGFWTGVFVGVVNLIPVAWPTWVQVPLLYGLSAIAIQYLLELFGRN